MTNLAELAEMLRASRRGLLAAASSVTADRAAIRPADGGWSVIEVVAHFIDTDHHYLREALAMRDDPNHLLLYFDDAAWKEEHQNVCEVPLADILASLRDSHEAVMRELAAMTDEDLDAPGLHPRGIPYSVRHVFLRWPEHDENHTRQIEEIAAALNSKA